MSGRGRVRSFTRIAGTYPTREEAEQAREQAARWYRTLPLQVKPHTCDKRRHSGKQWVVLSTLTLPAGDTSRHRARKVTTTAGKETRNGGA